MKNKSKPIPGLRDIELLYEHLADEERAKKRADFLAWRKNPRKEGGEKTNEDNSRSKH